VLAQLFIGGNGEPLPVVSGNLPAVAKDVTAAQAGAGVEPVLDLCQKIVVVVVLERRTNSCCLLSRSGWVAEEFQQSCAERIF
jgi:hypothetical protein